MPRLIVCLTGMPGAGKSTIARGLRGIGYEVASMGDAVRERAKMLGMEPTGENLGSLMLKLRRDGGPGAVANLLEPRIRGSASDVVVIDGIRSNAEIEVFRGICPVRILSVHASTETRYGLLSGRGRSDDPGTPEAFRERDGRELGVGISDSIALADESISNNDTDREGLVEAARGVILRWVGHG